MDTQPRIKIFDLVATIASIAVVVALTHFIAAAKASTAAEDFARKAVIGGAFEIESSKLALQRSQDDDVKQFAQTMVDDHSRIAKELESTLPKSTVDPEGVAKDLDPAHQQMLDKLKNASGGVFDRDYVRDQRSAHKEAVNLFQEYASSGSDQVLRAFAARTLPTLQHHLDMAKSLRVGVTRVGKASH